MPYGRFLTRMQVDERGPGREKAATLTFSCRTAPSQPRAAPCEEGCEKGTHILEVALGLGERVRFGQGDLDGRVTRRRVEEDGLGDAEAVCDSRQSGIGL